jgi:CRISPR/Cas system-associated exonuclease Cas4 (RecB family)
LGTYVNEFSWSKSRDAVFMECPRQYWFRYYGYWGGWEVGAPPRTRQIYVLKQLKSRHMWVGDLVHSAIARTLANLKSSRLPLAVDVDQIVELTIHGMRQDFKSSRAAQYRAKPKTCALFEHEYGVPVADEEWKRLAETVERCLRNFYASDVFVRIAASDRSAWLETEQLREFGLDGVKVYVRLDFAMREEGAVVIYDWKTGASDESDNSAQMACYAYYAKERWGIDPASVRPIEYNVNRDQLLVHSVTAADLERTCAYMRGSIADMKRLLRDPARNLAVEEDFRPDSERGGCRRCTFQRVCGAAADQP